MRLTVSVIVWTYFALALLYALNTPAWQVPDEPAHFNYIRTIAEQGALPVLQFGDYDQAYLEQIKTAHFPSNLPIDSIRYESHQPPLYYLLAAPVYALGAHEPIFARLFSLRVFSALLGALLLALTVRITLTVFPTEPIVALLAAALIAFIPQHLAMAGGVDNDALAEVVLAAIALLLIRMIGRPLSVVRRRNWLTLGLLIGIGFITKTTTYVSVGLLAVTCVLLWREAKRVIPLARHAVSAALPALLIGGAWFARDAATYGANDWLGLARHNAVVVGQPRTLELYPTYFAAAPDFFTTLFHSFWGQFGWMGVLLDTRIYVALFAFSVIALLGLIPFFVCTKLNHRQTNQLILLLAWFAFTFVSTLAYSLEYYQPQGRYLFPALPAIAIFAAMGLRGWLYAIEAVLAALHVSRLGAQRIFFGAFVLAFVALDLICLYRFIIPELSR